MQVRQGFDRAAAEAMKRAMGTDDPTFVDRAAKAPEFWGFFDPDPIGAAVLTEHEIHIAVTRPGRVGFAVRRIVNQAMKTRRHLFAAFDSDNEAVERLAIANGFIFLAEKQGHKLYGRLG